MMNYFESKNIKSQILRVFIPLCVFLSLSLTSCINSNFMFKAPTNYEYDSLVMKPSEQYKIAVNDQLKIVFYKEGGERILDLMSGTVQQGGASRSSGGMIGRSLGITYLVKQDSTAEFPTLGNIRVVGLTVQECKDTLVSRLKKDYKDPFVQVEVINKRVFVFPGEGGQAKVVSLKNENTTLMEALALSGGITDRGRSKSVRVMRKSGDEWKVFKINLSKIDGLEESDMIVQANDYIYVDPNPRLAREVLEEVAPIVSIISSAAVIVTVVRNLK